MNATHMMVTAVFFLVLGTPLWIAIWLGFAFRRHERPPRWPVFLALFMGCSPVVLMLRFGGSPGTELVLAGTAACLIVSGALSARRAWKWSCLRSLLTSALLVLLCFLTVDYHFRMLITDPRGQTLEVETDQIGFWKYGTFFGGSVSTQTSGTRLRRGVIYFGFAKWLNIRQATNFTVPLMAPGCSLYRWGDTRLRPSWSDWPIREIISDEEIQRATKR